MFSDLERECSSSESPRRPVVFSLYKFNKFQRQRSELVMAINVDSLGKPIPTSAVLMASSKHISTKCRMENMDFINCKNKDQNPEKCLDKGQEVTRCVLTLLKGLHQNCTKEMDAYAGCMYYNTNEFDLCRNEQQEFEKACPWNE